MVLLQNWEFPKFGRLFTSLLAIKQQTARKSKGKLSSVLLLYFFHEKKRGGKTLTFKNIK